MKEKIDFNKIQEKLNSDKSYSERFVKDPAGLLEEEGILLNKKMKKQLIEGIASQKVPSGSSVRADGGVIISISKDF